MPKCVDCLNFVRDLAKDGRNSPTGDGYCVFYLPIIHFPGPVPCWTAPPEMAAPGREVHVDRGMRYHEKRMKGREERRCPAFRAFKVRGERKKIGVLEGVGE